MPELPDVELFKRYADATALHKEVVKVRLTVDAPLEGISNSSCRCKLTGVSFTKTVRHGKYLFLCTPRISGLYFISA